MSSLDQLIAEAVALRMLFTKVTSSTTDHGAAPSWLRTVNSTAKPFCAAAQLCSRTLPSMWTRRAFLSSRMFLTAQRGRPDDERRLCPVEGGRRHVGAGDGRVG